MSEPEIQFGQQMLIYCYAQTPGHRKKGVLVEAFRYNGDGSWSQLLTSSWTKERKSGPDGLPYSGVTLFDDKRRDPDTPLSELVSSGVSARVTWDLYCPVCNPDVGPTADTTTAKGAVSFRKETLDRILTKAAEAGLTRLDLALLRRVIIASAP